MHKNIYLKLLLLILALCILFTSCTTKNTHIMNTGETVSAKESDSSFHTVSKDIENICKSDYLQMFIDKKTLAVGITDSANNHQWNSLPGKSNKTAFAFGLTLYTKNGVYELNTQDNSVCFGTASYEKTDNGVTVNYAMSDSKETAEKSYDTITKNDIYVEFSVNYTLYEQSMTINIDCSTIQATPGSVISQISVLPFLGASYEDSLNDYFLIPDESGVLMNLGKDDVNTSSVNIHVYGADPYITNDNSASATLPVFGVKRNNNAFAAIITDADALAQIIANRKTDKSPSGVNAVFNITPIRKTENKSEIHYGNTYTGKISVVYKFLADDSADYAGMASAAREEFINNNILSSANYKNKDDEIPFCISIIGSQDEKTLTTIQQATDILAILKAKGIDNIQLVFKGLLTGGFDQKNLYSADILSSLGGKDGYSELYNYTRMLNYSLLTDANILSSSRNYSSSESAFTVTGDKSSYLLINDLSFRNYNETRLSTRISAPIAASGFSKRNPDMYAQTKEYPMYLTDVSELPGNISSFLSGKLFSSADGISVGDAGYILYTDQNNSRQENKKIISSQLRAIGGNTKLSVKGGNIYTLYAADYISDMNFDSYYPESEAYEPVPFVQAVVHGSLLYSGKPIDAGDPLYRYDMLQCIEYGAIPAFEWIYSTSNIFCYDGYLLSERITEINEFYKKADDALYSVSSAVITDHRKITSNADGKTISGVYCTTYSNGTEIYVNYTGTPVVTPENIVVGAYDFIKITR